MRTTLNIDDDLLKAAKIAAIQEGTTLTALVEEGLRQRVLGNRSGDWEIPAHIDRDDPAAVAAFVAYMESKKHNKWTPPRTSNARLRPDVDLNRTSELIETLEGPFARP